MPLLPTEQAIAAGSLNDVQYDLQTLTFNFSYRYYCGDPSVAAGTLIPMPFKLLQQWNPASEYRLFGMRYNLTASGGVRCTDFGWGVNNTPLKALLGVGFTDQAGAYTVPGVPGSIIMNESVASDANVGPTLTVNGIICKVLSLKAEGYLPFLPGMFIIPVGKVVSLVGQSNTWWGFVEGSVTFYLRITGRQ